MRVRALRSSDSSVITVSIIPVACRGQVRSPGVWCSVRTAGGASVAPPIPPPRIREGQGASGATGPEPCLTDESPGSSRAEERYLVPHELSAGPPESLAATSEAGAPDPHGLVAVELPRRSRVRRRRHPQAIGALIVTSLSPFGNYDVSDSRSWLDGARRGVTVKPAERPSILPHMLPLPCVPRSRSGQRGQLHRAAFVEASLVPGAVGRDNGKCIGRVNVLAYHLD